MNLSIFRKFVNLSKATLLLSAMIWGGTGNLAMAGHGGGGGHGGGHAGGHTGGGHYGGGHHAGGWGGGGYHHNGYHPGGGYYRGYYGGYYPFFGLGYGGYGYGGYGYGGYGYGGYGYGNGYSSYPYYGYSNGGYVYSDPNTGYAMTYTYPSTTITQAGGPYLGITEQPAVDSGGTGMQVMSVNSGSAADRAGLQAGDVIHSINGYNTQAHGNIAWIIQNAAPNGTLTMNVRHAGATDNVVVVANVR